MNNNLPFYFILYDWIIMLDINNINIKYKVNSLFNVLIQKYFNILIQIYFQ